MIEKIIQQLKSNARPFKQINNFSDQPGIYALFYFGNTFPLKDYRHSENEIIYIGKTLKSQKSRDADTHFKSGKTGSSTLRKTFGSLLCNQIDLIPIPRSQSDIDKKRFAHFKFDNISEEKLTKWMETYLGLSFYPYPKSAAEIDMLETLLINELVPILNIDRKNISNQYYTHIRSLRKQMGEKAYSTLKGIVTSPFKEVQPKLRVSNSNISISTNSIHKYEDIWNQIMPLILQSIRDSKPLTIQLTKEIFDKAGNRKSYSFNLQFRNGRVSNNIGGSAVARDLARVLENNNQFKNFSIKKDIQLRMGNEFTLEIIL